MSARLIEREHAFRGLESNKANITQSRTWGDPGHRSHLPSISVLSGLSQLTCVQICDWGDRFGLIEKYQI
jgi:hypothetical protein